MAEARFDEVVFFRRPRPQGRPPWLLWSTETSRRLAWICFLGGLGAVVVNAFSPASAALFGRAIVEPLIGAPIFEEVLKFGAALLLVARWTGRWAFAARHAAAMVVGLAFGVAEHFVTFPQESASLYARRLLLHALTTMVSMAVFHVLEPGSDTRVRWMALAPAIAVHFANNAAAMLAVLLMPVWPSFRLVVLVWAVFLLVVLGAVLAVANVAAVPVRRSVEAWVRERFPHLPPAWRP